MSSNSLRGSAAIVGAALAGLGEAPGRSSEEIAIEASVKALAEAGLTTRHVDAVFGSLPGNANPLSGLLIAEMLGMAQIRVLDVQVTLRHACFSCRLVLLL